MKTNEPKIFASDRSTEKMRFKTHAPQKILTIVCSDRWNSNKWRWSNRNCATCRLRMSDFTALSIGVKLIGVIYRLQNESTNTKICLDYYYPFTPKLPNRLSWTLARTWFWTRKNMKATLPTVLLIISDGTSLTTNFFDSFKFVENNRLYPTGSRDINVRSCRSR